MTVEELLTQVEGLSEYERTSFLKLMMEKYGIKADPIPAVKRPDSDYGACPAYGGSPGSRVSEPQYDFSVNLDNVGPNKIHVIKVLRDLIPGFGLKEAKDAVDRVQLGERFHVHRNVSRAEADIMREHLEDAGARVTVT